MTEATTSSTISSDSPTHAPNPFHLAHAITNIKSLIPITIDIKNPNYQKWSHFFAIAVGRFALHDVLHGAERPPFISSDDWNRADYLLQSWIYSTISDDLSSMILSKTANAHDLWLALSSLFTDNKDYRAVQLEEKFKSLKKGSLSIHDYCQSIKLTANSLADVGHSLTDKQLVLQTLHGLPRSYSTVVNLISFQNPLPSFLQTRSLLRMEETRLAEPETQPTILYTHPQPSPYSSPAPGCGGGGNYRGGRGRGGRGRGRGGPRFPQSHMQSFGYQQYNQSPRRPPPPINQFSAPPSPAHYQAPSPAPATRSRTPTLLSRRTPCLALFRLLLLRVPVPLFLGCNPRSHPPGFPLLNLISVLNLMPCLSAAPQTQIGTWTPVPHPTWLRMQVY